MTGAPQHINYREGACFSKDRGTTAHKSQRGGHALMKTRAPQHINHREGGML